jgi:transposase-like protein
MYLHANAKLGLAGRFALVRAIEEGMSLKAAAAAFSVSPATAHRWWHRWSEAGQEARRTLSCLLDRSSRRSARLGGSRPSSSRRSVPAVAAPAGGRGWSQERPASCTRRCGRCSVVPGSRGHRARPRSRPTATSGRARATCCTWTCPATRAFCGLATASPATARSAPTGCGPRRGAATTTRTRSSTTTRGWPTSSCTTTRRRRP